MTKNYLFIVLVLIVFSVNNAFSQTESAIPNPLSGKKQIYVESNKIPKVDTKRQELQQKVPRGMTDAVNAYVVTRTTGITYTPIVGGAVTSWRNGADADDNLSNAQPIGFSLVYNGVRTDSFRVGTSGFITFNTTSGATGASGPYGWDNTTFSAANGSTNTLGGMFEDLNAVALTNIVYETSGAPGSRILTVQFSNMQVFGNATPNLNFQIKVYEADGHIEYVYGSMTAGTATYAYSCGINAATLSAVPTTAQLLTQQTVNTNSFSNTAQNALATVPTSNSMLSFTVSGQTVPNSPTSLTFSNVSGVSMTLNWVDNSSNETEFPIYISTDGINYNYIGAAAANATSINIVGLTPTTTYWFQVWAANETKFSTASANGSQMTSNVTPLSGVYTINPSLPVSATNFQSFAQADTALSNNGVSGPVTINVSGGTYAEVVVLLPIGGTSSTNTVKFVGPVSDARVVVKPVGTSATNNYAIGLFSCDWVTFQNIDVEDGGTTTANQVEYGYVLQNFTNADGTTNNTIRDCNILLGGGGVVPGFSHGVLQSTLTTATAGNNNNTYTNIKIDRSDRGVAVFGLTAPAVPTEDNITISNCLLGSTFPIGDSLTGTSGSAIGIIVSNGKNANVFGNNIVSVQAKHPSTTQGPIGLSCQNSSGSFYNNIIRDVYQGSTTSNTARPCGIQGSGLLPDTSKIYNNFVSGIRKGYTGVTPTATVALTGLRSTQQGGAGVVRWDFNTVYLSAPAPVYWTSCAFASFAGGVGMQTKDNILINNISTASATARSVAIQEANATAFLVSDYNDLYAPGTNGAVGLNGAATFRTTLLDWQTANPTLDANSKSVAVTFVNTATGDLHLAGGSLSDPNLNGTPIPGITTDIDGTTRSLTTPTMGADEAVATQTLNLTVKMEGYTLLDTITVELRNNTAPYAIVESVKGMGGLASTQPITFSSAVNGTPYAIVVKYRNGIATWSSGDVTFAGGVASYNFTTALSQAYASNQKLVGGQASIFQGDVNQSGGINLADITSIYNAATSFTSGYNVNNLINNATVNLASITIAFNNASAFVVVKPRP